MSWPKKLMPALNDVEGLYNTAVFELINKTIMLYFKVNKDVRNFQQTDSVS